MQKRLSEINQYESQTVNPASYPDTVYELYSVPSFDTGKPEITTGKNIGSSKNVVKDGDVLVCKINPRINRVWVVRRHSDHPLLASSEWIVVRNPRMNSDYLKWYFSSEVFRALITSHVAGIGGSLTRAQPKQVAKYLVPVPELAKQEQIVRRLDALEKLIQIRNKQLNKIDVLVKSQFIEMFGDPVTNPKKLSILPWSEVFNAQTGKLDSNAAVEDGVYPFFTCAKEWLWINEYAYDCEALLLAGNNAAGIYDVKHYKGKFNAYQRTYILELKDSKWSYPLFQLQLESKLKYLEGQSRGTNTRYLTLGILKGLLFVVPEYARQQEFTNFSQHIDKSKFAIRQSIAQLEILKKSLMQKYFG